jgi:hypothetical protein
LAERSSVMMQFNLVLGTRVCCARQLCDADCALSDRGFHRHLGLQMTTDLGTSLCLPKMDSLSTQTRRQGIRRRSRSDPSNSVNSLRAYAQPSGKENHLESAVLLEFSAIHRICHNHVPYVNRRIDLSESGKRIVHGNPKTDAYSSAGFPHSWDQLSHHQRLDIIRETEKLSDARRTPSRFAQEPQTIS